MFRTGIPKWVVYPASSSRKFAGKPHPELSQYWLVSQLNCYQNPMAIRSLWRCQVHRINSNLTHLGNKHRMLHDDETSALDHSVQLIWASYIHTQVNRCLLSSVGLLQSPCNMAGHDPTIRVVATQFCHLIWGAPCKHHKNDNNNGHLVPNLKYIALIAYKSNTHIYIWT